MSGRDPNLDMALARVDELASALGLRPARLCLATGSIAEAGRIAAAWRDGAVTLGEARAMLVEADLRVLPEAFRYG